MYRIVSSTLQRVRYPDYLGRHPSPTSVSALLSLLSPTYLPSRRAALLPNPPGDPPSMRREAQLPHRMPAHMRRVELAPHPGYPSSHELPAPVYLPLAELRHPPHQRPHGETPRGNFRFGVVPLPNPAILVRLADDADADGVEDDVPAAAREGQKGDPLSYHKDPADRIIIATSLAYNLTVVTGDGKFPQYGVRTIC